MEEDQKEVRLCDVENCGKPATHPQFVENPYSCSEHWDEYVAWHNAKYVETSKTWGGV